MARAVTPAHKHLDIVFLDTETTGLNSDSEVIELAITDRYRQVLLHTYIKPIRPIDEEGEAFKINGISNEMVANSPTFPELYDEVTEHLWGKAIVAYNSDFDERMLKQSCQLHNLNIIEADWLCMMQTVKQKTGMRVTLQKACSNFRVEAEPDHSAINDTFALHGLAHVLLGGI